MRRPGSTVKVNSPWAIEIPLMAPGRAAAIASPSCCRLPSITTLYQCALKIQFAFKTPRERIVPTLAEFRNPICPEKVLPLDRAGAADLLLEEQYAIEERFRRGRAAGNVDIDGHDSVAAAHDRIGIVVIAAAIGAGTHRDHITRLRHLIVDLAQGRGHFVAERAGDDHHIGLTRRAARRETATLDTAAWHVTLPHFD